MNTRKLLLQQLDQQLDLWQIAHVQAKIPRAGWVKTIRKALGMTAEQLAARLGVKRGRVTQLEEAEIHDAVTLHALKKAAEAMECELIYAIVPKQSTTLKAILQNRAEKIAAETIARVNHSMSLESQAVNNETLLQQQKELAKKLLLKSPKQLWRDDK